MAFPVTLNGRTYTLTDFEGTNYVDGLPDAFEDFVTHAGDIYNSTSTTSNSIGTGSKTFTVEANKPYQAGTPLRIADAAAPSTNFLDTVVTSYSGTTLVVNSIGYGGSGTKTSWTVNIGGAKTVDGTLGLSQGGTGATTAAAARTNLDTYSKSEADSRFLNVSGEASDVTMNGNTTIGDASSDTLTVNATATFSNAGDQSIPLTVSNTDSDSNTYIKYLDNGGQYWTTGINYANDDFYLNYNGNFRARFLNAGGLEVTRGDNDAVLIIKSSDADANDGPIFDLIRESSTPADNDAIGSIRWKADDSAGNETQYADIRVFTDDVTDGTEDVNFTLRGIRNGTLVSRFAFNSSEMIINDSSNDVDFRVESDNTATMLFVDAANDRLGVNVGSSPSYTLDVGGDGIRHIQTGGGSIAKIRASTDNNTDLIMSARTTDSNGTRTGIIANGYPNASYSATIARDDADFSAIGWQFYTLNSTYDSQTHAILKLELTDNSEYELIKADYGNVIINEGSRDIDFRVESDGNANAIFVNAAEDRVHFFGTDGNPDNNTGSARMGLITSDGRISFAAYQVSPATFNRLNNDGTIVSLRQNGSEEGSISVSGTTVSYNGGHLARWAQTTDNTRIDSLVKGTVMTNLDQMAAWGSEENEQLNCMAVSSVEGDSNVAGVFVNWDDDDGVYTADMNIAMTGDMIIRIAQGTTVQRGDLLMSAGDGTAKPQGDDIVRSKTIAKVTSNHVSNTYDDGTYCVPCVLMAC